MFCTVLSIVAVVFLLGALRPPRRPARPRTVDTPPRSRRSPSSTSTPRPHPTSRRCPASAPKRPTRIVDYRQKNGRSEGGGIDERPRHRREETSSAEAAS